MNEELEVKNEAGAKCGKSVQERVVMCDNCPECGDCDTIDTFDNSLGDGYRVCATCQQEWWTDVDYPEHIDKKAT